MTVAFFLLFGLVAGVVLGAYFSIKSFYNVQKEEIKAGYFVVDGQAYTIIPLEKEKKRFELHPMVGELPVIPIIERKE